MKSLPEFMDSDSDVMRRIEEQRLQEKPIEARWPSLFRALFTLPTRRRTREYIEQHPELLSDAALNDLDRRIQSIDHSEPAKMMQHYRNLLAGCRENGIEAALADATELFYEDELLEPFDDFGPEVLSVVSGLARRGLSFQQPPNPSESAEQEDPDTQLPAPLRHKAQRAKSERASWHSADGGALAWQNPIRSFRVGAKLRVLPHRDQRSECSLP